MTHKPTHLLSLEKRRTQMIIKTLKSAQLAHKRRGNMQQVLELQELITPLVDSLLEEE